MGDFNQFSEAAILYARNAVLVTEMRGAMTEDIDKFLKTLGKRIESIADPWEHQKDRTDSGNIYWWLTESGEKPDKDKQPYLWFGEHDPKIVHPGRFKALACTPKTDKETFSRLAAIALRPELAGFCKPLKGTWALFEVVIKFDGDDPFEVAAGHLATILMALREVATEQASP